MCVAVDEPGHDEVAGVVDALIAVKTDANIDDPVAFDDNIGDTCPTGAGVENVSAGQQGARHVPRHRTTRPDTGYR